MADQLSGSKTKDPGLDMAYAAEVTLVPSGLAQLTWVDPFIFCNKSRVFMTAYLYTITITPQIRYSRLKPVRCEKIISCSLI